MPVEMKTESSGESSSGFFAVGCLLAFVTFSVAFTTTKDMITTMIIIVAANLIGGGVIGLFFRRKSNKQLIVPGIPYFSWGFLVVIGQMHEFSVEVLTVFLVFIFTGFLPGLGIFLGNELKVAMVAIWSKSPPDRGHDPQ